MVYGALGRHKAMGCKPDKLGTFGMQVRLSWRIAAMEEGPQLRTCAPSAYANSRSSKLGTWFVVAKIRRGAACL